MPYLNFAMSAVNVAVALAIQSPFTPLNWAVAVLMFGCGITAAINEAKL